MELFLRSTEQFVHLVRFTLLSGETLEAAMKFIPFVLCFELPYQALVMFGVVRHYLQRGFSIPHEPRYFPTVSCLVTCYAEKEAVRQTVYTLAHQIYPGFIEVILLIDGATRNSDTLAAARRAAAEVEGLPNRRVRVVPKWQRGGRVSSLNSGLALARGEIVLALDGDTSFDNDMIYNCARRFSEPHVVGVAGNLRVRNTRASLCTRMQAIEYMLAIATGRTGLSQLRTLNNISGAFGIFRRSFLQAVGGWRTGTAEDLDLTTRIKNYFGRHPHLRIVFEPRAVGHTDVPDTFAGLLGQRVRWDGDLSFIYLRRYWRSFTPGIFGWRNFIFYAGFGLLFQLIAPFAIVIYTMFMMFTRDPAVVLGVLLFVYLFYLVATLVFFMQYLLMVSERPRFDAGFIWVFPVFPLYTFALRVWSALATLREIFLKTNLDTAMAPWWVLRRMK